MIFCRTVLLDDNVLKEISFNVNSEEVLSISTKQQLDSLLQKYKEIFESDLLSIKDKKARLTLKKEAVYLKHRTIPFKLLPLMDKEIKDLEAAGILIKVDTSEWATPIPVFKKRR